MTNNKNNANVDSINNSNSKCKLKKNIITTKIQRIIISILNSNYVYFK